MAERKHISSYEQLLKEIDFRYRSNMVTKTHTVMSDTNCVQIYLEMGSSTNEMLNLHQ